MFLKIAGTPTRLSSDTSPKTKQRNLSVITSTIGARGGAVVEALRYKPEGRGIDSRWCH
jgi:hypothetical protein